MAHYIEATETQDPERRSGVVAEILDYKREDLAAMWAVFEWLRRKGSAGGNAVQN